MIVHIFVSCILCFEPEFNVETVQNYSDYLRLVTVLSFLIFVHFHYCGYHLRLINLKPGIYILAGPKNGQNFVKKLVGPIFDYGHQSICLRLVVNAILSVFSRKCCGAKSCE